MSNPRRKYSPYRVAQKVSDASLKKVAVAFVTGHNDYCKFVDVVKMQIRNPNSLEYKHLSKIPHHWCIHIAALSTKSTGDYMEYKVLRSTQRVLHMDLVATFNEQHQALLKSVNQSRLVAAGWVACPAGNELTELQLMSIFGLMKGWSPEVFDERTTTSDDVSSTEPDQHINQP